MLSEDAMAGGSSTTDPTSAVPTTMTATTGPTSDEPVDTDEQGSSTTESDTAMTTGMTSGSDTGGETDGGQAQPEMVSYAIRVGDVPDDEPGGSDSVGTTGVASTVGSGQLDKDTLLVNIGFNTGSCDEPSADTTCGTWEASFDLELDEQVPGEYEADVVNLIYAEHFEPGALGECGSGFGVIEARVVIDSIDDVAVVGRILDVIDEPFESVTLEGFEFTAPRC